MAGALNYGDAAGRAVSQRLAAPVASMTALKGLLPRERVLGMTCLVNGVHWRYHDTSTLTGDDILVSTPTDAPAAGRWLRLPGAAALVLPFTFATVDAAALLTFQAGQKFRIADAHWLIAVSMTGGTNAAIGLSSAKTGFSAKGDILGGSGGDLLATLVASASPTLGTPGTKMDTIAHLRAGLFIATDIFRFDRVVDAFTAGSGSISVMGHLIANDGA